MQQRKRRPTKSVSCPKCGYCDKCGRSNAAPVWPWPVVYPNPYVLPTPYQPYWQPNTIVPLTTISVSGTSTTTPAGAPLTTNAYYAKADDPYVVGHFFTANPANDTTTVTYSN